VSVGEWSNDDRIALMQIFEQAVFFEEVGF
jgi:hypothetical protein